MLALLLLLAAPQDPVRDPEAMCLVTEAKAQTDAGRTADIVAAAAVCRARYDWNDAAADRARSIAVGYAMILDQYKKARDLGVSQDAMDRVWADLPKKTIADFGLLGDTDKPGFGRGVSALDKRFTALGVTGEAGGEAVAALGMRAVLINEIRKFDADRAAKRAAKP